MSQVNFDTWQNAAGTVTYYGATAWVNFNGTGTVAIRDSENVSSITDVGTGDYIVNFTTAFANTNYCPIVTARITSSATVGYPKQDVSITSSSCGFATFNISSALLADAAYVLVAVFGGN